MERPEHCAPAELPTKDLVPKSEPAQTPSRLRSRALRRFKSPDPKVSAAIKERREKEGGELRNRNWTLNLGAFELGRLHKAGE